jgi:hypothetical protein
MIKGLPNYALDECPKSSILFQKTLTLAFTLDFGMQSFTSAISDFAMAYVDWIVIQEFIRPPTVSLAVGKVTEVEWTTGPKQRTNQWSCPPFILLEKVLPSRYAVGLDPATEGSKSKVLALIALDPERIEANNPEFMMDVGDRKFPYYQQRKSRYANNIISEEKEEEGDSDDDISSVNSSVNSRNAVEPPLTCALPPNIMDYLTFVDSTRL